MLFYIRKISKYIYCITLCRKNRHYRNLGTSRLPVRFVIYRTYLKFPYCACLIFLLLPVGHQVGFRLIHRGISVKLSLSKARYQLRLRGCWPGNNYRVKTQRPGNTSLLVSQELRLNLLTCAIGYFPCIVNNMNSRRSG